MLTLSLMGLYKTQIANEENTFLSGTYFKLPESFDAVDSAIPREVLVNLILAESADLEVLYPDPDTMNIVVKAWSMARLQSWERMEEALNAEYNPIHNYDRSESWTEEREGEDSKAGTNDRSTGSTTTGSSSATLTQNVAGYNSSTATVPKASDSSSGQDSTTIAGTQDDEWSEDGSHSETVTKSGTISGNIGVTTSQQMLESELELRKMDLVNIIKQEFISYFCLGVY